MAPESRYYTDAENGRAESARLRRMRWVRLGIVYGLVIPLAVLTMLPLIWMIVTAFKRPGQAFKLTFIPNTELVTEPHPVSFPKGDSAEPVVWFQFVDAGAREVSVAGDFNGWNADANRLARFGDVWLARLTGLTPGPHEYKFVVNGATWQTDPENPKKMGDNSLVSVAAVGETWNAEPRSRVAWQEGRLTARVQIPAALGVGLRLPDGRIEKMTADAAEPGVWRCEAALPEPPPAEGMPLRLRQSFGDALGQIYTVNNFLAIVRNPNFPFGRFFMNSLLVAGGAALLTCAICLLAAYAFAKKRFRGKEYLFAGLLSAMLIPGLIFVVPQFSLVIQLHWMNTYWGMVIPHLSNVFGLFLLRQHIAAIPDDLFAAADIDGANEVQRLRQIVIPLAWPILVTLFLLVFIGQWSNFLWQLIINTPDSPWITLPVGLQYFKGQYGQDWEAVMAGACFSLIPIAILVAATQRYLIEGVTAGAVKE